MNCMLQQTLNFNIYILLGIFFPCTQSGSDWRGRTQGKGWNAVEDERREGRRRGGEGRRGEHQLLLASLLQGFVRYKTQGAAVGLHQEHGGHGVALLHQGGRNLVGGCLRKGGVQEAGVAERACARRCRKQAVAQVGLSLQHDGGGVVVVPGGGGGGDVEVVRPRGAPGWGGAAAGGRGVEGVGAGGGDEAEAALDTSGEAAEAVGQGAAEVSGHCAVDGGSQAGVESEEEERDSVGHEHPEGHRVALLLARRLVVAVGDNFF